MTGRRRRVAILLGATATALAMALPAQAAATHLPFTTTPLDATAPVNRSIGKLFLSHPSGVGKCTAVVVDAPNQSTLLTAGHCLNSATNGGTTSARFVPGYHDGIEPFGGWTSARLAQAAPWAASRNSRFDFAFVVVGRNRAGKAVEDVVGALPIAFNQPRNQAYRLFGFPEDPTPPYDGQRLWACDSSYGGDVADALSGPPRMLAGCDFQDEASGGPWLSAQGAVASVISAGSQSHPDIISGPYLGDEAAAFFASVANISTAPRRRCKKHRKGKKRAAAAKKKKCKRHGKRR